jgi:hypothetical protein
LKKIREEESGNYRKIRQQQEKRTNGAVEDCKIGRST